MKRTLVFLAVALLFCVAPASAQPNELAELKAQLLAQQTAIQRLLDRIAVLEKQQAATVTKPDLERQEQAQDDAVNSMRETLLGKVNLSGYYNFRAFADGSETPAAFQQHHLGLILGKQLGRFSFFTELELQNIPHHPQISETGESSSEMATTDLSGEGQVSVENAWMEYSQNQYLNIRVGKQLSPQYWWQNHYPNLTYSTDQPIYLRELFPPEIIGVMVKGSASRPAGSSEWGLGYNVYVANNELEGNERGDLARQKSWGGRVQVRMPVGGFLKKFDVAADMYRGRIALDTNQLADDSVFGFESQLESGPFRLNAEYAHGETLGLTRFGYYVEPAFRVNDNWLTFYRVEGLESARVQRAEQRHLAGVNFRPLPQIALKMEYYRSLPKSRSFIDASEIRKPFNGVAAAAVFFF
jgi:hypothetical protein